MPADQIQIRWSTWSGANYDDSMAALKEYDPIPSVKAACNIKGTMPKAAIDRIMAIVNEFDADASIIMTATWGKDASPTNCGCLALTARPPPRPTPMGVEDLAAAPAADADSPGTNQQQRPPQTRPTIPTRPATLPMRRRQWMRRRRNQQVRTARVPTWRAAPMAKTPTNLSTRVRMATALPSAPPRRLRPAPMRLTRPRTPLPPPPKE